MTESDFEKGYDVKYARFSPKKRQRGRKKMPRRGGKVEGWKIIGKNIITISSTPKVVKKMLKEWEKVRKVFPRHKVLYLNGLMRGLKKKVDSYEL